MPKDYRSAPGLNWSRLKHIDVSPLHFRHRETHPITTTAAMAFGTLAHMAVLEPDRFDREVVVFPGKTRRGKAWDEFQAEHASRTIAKDGERDAARAIADAVRAHPHASRLLTGGDAEVPMFWEEEVAGKPRTMKGLADYLRAADGVTLVDLKITNSIKPRRFLSHIAKMGWHGQMAHYAAGVEALTGTEPACYIVAVEPDAPHDVGVFHVHEDALYAGAEWRRELLEKWARAVDTDTWPGQVPDVEPVDLPKWAFPDDDDPMNAIRIG